MIHEVYQLKIARLNQIRAEIEAKGLALEFTNQDGAKLFKDGEFIYVEQLQPLLDEYEAIRFQTDPLTDDFDGSFIEDVSPIEATHSMFKEFKKELGLNNADIAEIVGLTPDSVKTMTQPNKELPSWAKAMVFTWQKILK